MQISSDTALWPDTTETTRRLSRSRNITTVNEEAKKADEIQLGGSPFPVRKELTPEEEQRVQFLQNLLAQTMAMAEGNPTDEQKTRIRDIENELEKITGVKSHSRLTKMTAKMPGKTDEEEEKERERKYQPQGIDPKEAVHNNKPLTDKGDNPGMQMLRQNALLTSISFKGLSSLTPLAG
ncbi:hypothetical protein BerOc1_03500 [Pseudodesulfovibrio hydrargyri]|uniref:Uncharacterized protein n=1 Tax=Pseudodesulfovibrio hydrargyri TaxID=2125990 RepID=A0A1J5MZB3_9BACT|nr:hypothetical protein [Pseudodesulfovibrio hydrargyri]OIQ48747.1 hypothetical protein BerOc1_03500 [Pseudodesulfovibrio hydrargyri]